jgi:hypothetical protein
MRQHAVEIGPELASAPIIDRPPDPAAVAQARLRDSAYRQLQNLTCDSHEGVLAIRGRVTCFYYKQLAQTAVRDIPGVEVIHNQVQVDRADR